MSRYRVHLFVILGVCALLLYLYGAIEHLNHVNTSLKASDQQSYLRYARKLATEEGFLGGRNRMPLYPLLQSFFYEEGMSDEVFFIQARLVNVILSLIVLLLLYPIVRRYLDALTSACLVLVTAFTVFLFKAGYVQAEILFYMLNFGCFVLMGRMLRAPTWKSGLLTGLLLGLAHLTKASILPGLALFVLLYAVRHVLGALRVLRGDSTAYRQRLAIVTLVMALLTFLATVFPYIRNSYLRFGRPFYNVNSTFYMWYDSWEEVKAGTRAHGDRKGWPDMPPEEIPSPARYFREHTAKQVLDRIINGLKTLAFYCTHTYGYHKYVLLYLLFAVGIAWGNRAGARRLLRENLWLTLFLACYFAGYLVLYAWYVPIAGPGDRFILGQFLPFMFALSYGITRLSWPQPLLSWGRVRLSSLRLFHIATLALLLPDIYVILTQRIYQVYGGS